MKGLPDSVIVGTITNARRRAVQRDIAARRAGAAAARRPEPTLAHYVGGIAMLLAFILVSAIIL